MRRLRERELEAHKAANRRAALVASMITKMFGGRGMEPDEFFQYHDEDAHMTGEEALAALKGWFGSPEESDGDS